MENNSHIYKISASLTSKGLGYMITKWNCEKKKTIYKLTRKFEGEIIERRINIQSIQDIKSSYLDFSNTIEYTTYSFEKDISKNLDILKEKILNRVIYLKSKIDNFLSIINESDDNPKIDFN
jgi:hypothetical protein